MFIPSNIFDMNLLENQIQIENIIICWRYDNNGFHSEYDFKFYKYFLILFLTSIYFFININYYPYIKLSKFQLSFTNKFFNYMAKLNKRPSTISKPQKRSYIFYYIISWSKVITFSPQPSFKNRPKAFY